MYRSWNMWSAGVELQCDKYSGISMDGEKAEIILNLEIQFATAEIMEISSWINDGIKSLKYPKKLKLSWDCRYILLNESRTLNGRYILRNGRKVADYPSWISCLSANPTPHLHFKYPPITVENLQTRQKEYIPIIKDIYLLSFFLEILAKNACKCRNRQRIAVTIWYYCGKFIELYCHPNTF